MIPPHGTDKILFLKTRNMTPPLEPHAKMRHVDEARSFRSGPPCRDVRRAKATRPLPWLRSAWAKKELRETLKLVATADIQGAVSSYYNNYRVRMRSKLSTLPNIYYITCTILSKPTPPSLWARSVVNRLSSSAARPDKHAKHHSIIQSSPKG